MTCLEVQELLSAFVDNELDKNTMQKVQKHINNCPSCRKELEELKVILDELASLEDVSVPEIFDERLHKALVLEGISIRDSKKIDIKNKKKINWKAISSLAAVFMVGLLTFILYNNNLEDFSNKDFSSDSYVLEQSTESTETNENIEEEESSTEDVEDIKKNQEESSNQHNSEIKEKAKASEETKKEETKEDETMVAPKVKSIQADEEDIDTNDYLERQLYNQQLDAQESTSSNAILNSNDKYQTPEGISLKQDDEEVNQYLNQLDEILIDTSYIVNSYNKDIEKNLWIINVTIITTDKEGTEIKEDTVYYGQDGEIWKEE